MTWWQAIVLGLTQGLTEFLPVSSSGHLTFLERIFNIGAEGATFFNLLLHLGTLVAVCYTFRRDMAALFRRPFDALLKLIAASIPAAVAGLTLEYFGIIDEYINKSARLGTMLACFFLITAVTLFAAEVFAKRRKKAYPLTCRVTLTMGFAQAAAILPGISRSGFTVAFGTFAGGESEEISHFSFLMSVPIILGGFLVELIKGFAGDGFFPPSGGGQYGWCMALGFLFSACAGLFAIKIMLAAVSRASYKWFSLYLILLAAVCLALDLSGNF